MANILVGLLHGMVIETTTESWTGEYLYSDFATKYGQAEKDSQLNTIVKIPFLGIVGGIVRVALGIIHTLGHLTLAVIKQDKGHIFHASKGLCEVLRGLIESVPLIGRIFANFYNSAPINDPFHEGSRTWWMIKIYNPQKPDGLDVWMNYWHPFPSAFYVKA